MANVSTKMTVAIVGSSLLGVSVYGSCVSSSPLRNLAEADKVALSSAVLATPEKYLGREVIVQGNLKFQDREAKHVFGVFSEPPALYDWLCGKGGGIIYTTTYELTDQSNAPLPLKERLFSQSLMVEKHEGTWEIVGKITRENGSLFLLVDRVPMVHKD